MARCEYCCDNPKTLQYGYQTIKVSGGKLIYNTSPHMQDAGEVEIEYCPKCGRRLEEKDDEKRTVTALRSEQRN